MVQRSVCIATPLVATLRLHLRLRIHLHLDLHDNLNEWVSDLRRGFLTGRSMLDNMVEMDFLSKL